MKKFDKIKVTSEQVRDSNSKLTAEEQAMICNMIVSSLKDKVLELEDLYNKFCTTYPVEIAITGIAVVACVDSPALSSKSIPPAALIAGCKEGVMQCMSRLVDNVDIMLNDKENNNG